MNAAHLILLLSVLPLAAMTKGALAITIDWVTVGNPGNANDTATVAEWDEWEYGAVNYEYRIGKYEVTIQQYTDFLNAVAATDPYSLYNPRMATDLRIAGISRSGTSGEFNYSVMNNRSPSGNRPITYVSWFDAARLANWMHNGQGSGSTETGAYTLNGATSGDAPARNEGAQFYIPTENEWYKAAYYSPVLNSGSGGYWTYATQSNTAPGNTIGSGANQANYRRNNVFSVTQSSSYSLGQNYLTEVGAFTNSASFYGTFDQTGNVFEWNDVRDAVSVVRGSRGGSWGSRASDVSSTNVFGYNLPSAEDLGTGFRLASPAPSSNILLHVSFGTQTQGSAGYPLLTPDNAGSVTKTGAGMVVFDAANTYTGPTRIQQGVLAITGPSTISSSSLLSLSSGASLDVRSLGGGYTVPSGQTIGGSGTVLGSVTFGAGSTLSPGMLSTASGASMLAADMQAGSLEAHVVPEPGTLGLVVVGVGFLGLEALRRKRA